MTSQLKIWANSLGNLSNWSRRSFPHIGFKFVHRVRTNQNPLKPPKLLFLVCELMRLFSPNDRNNQRRWMGDNMISSNFNISKLWLMNKNMGIDISTNKIDKFHKLLLTWMISGVYSHVREKLMKLTLPLVKISIPKSIIKSASEKNILREFYFLLYISILEHVWQLDIVIRLTIATYWSNKSMITERLVCSSAFLHSDIT